MKDEIKELRVELENMKARLAADTAFLRCSIFTLSTLQLRSTEVALAKVAEDMSVRLIYSKTSDEANQTFSERHQFWLNAISAEVAAREAALRETIQNQAQDRQP